MFADTRFRYLEGIRQVATIVLYPLQRAVQLPGEALAWVGDVFRVEAGAGRGKRRVEAGPCRKFALGAGIRRKLRDENANLRALLDLQKRYSGAATAVEVLYTGRDPFTQKLFVDAAAMRAFAPAKRSSMPMGVVGQVTRVFPGMAEVTLVTDKDHAVPVRVDRSGVRSVFSAPARGGAPELRFMAPTADIKPGDSLSRRGSTAPILPDLR